MYAIKCMPSDAIEYNIFDEEQRSSSGPLSSALPRRSEGECNILPSWLSRDENDLVLSPRIKTHSWRNHEEEEKEEGEEEAEGREEGGAEEEGEMGGTRIN